MQIAVGSHQWTLVGHGRREKRKKEKEKRTAKVKSRSPHKTWWGKTADQRKGKAWTFL